MNARGTMSRAITTLRTAPGGRHSLSSRGAGGLKLVEEVPCWSSGAAQAPAATWRQSPAGAPQTEQPRGRVAGSVESGVLASVGDEEEVKSEVEEEELEPEEELLELDPHAAASQSTAGAPKVYAGDSATGGSTPRLRNISISSVPSDPPKEWPAKTTLANGLEATCSTTSGKKRSYSRSAAS